MKTKVSMTNLLLLAALSVGMTLPAAAQARVILYSADVPANQASLLEGDVKKALDIDQNDADLLKKSMGQTDISAAAIQKWLTDRVGYVIGEDEDFRRKLSIVKEKYAYQNPGVFPDVEEPQEEQPATPGMQPQAVETDGPQTPQAPEADPQATEEGGPMVVMGNMGAAFYHLGKEKGILVGYNFTQAGKSKVVAITSPRTGIIQIGEGLFKILVNKKDIAAYSNAYFRVSTLLHEAHHSDGNGKTLGFFHALCPKGHAYENVNACDRNSNGPYMVDAAYMKQARTTCIAAKTCTAAEAELMATLAVDSFSRVIDKGVWDARPEGL